MFIIKFNKLIHNKLLWGAFATIVAIAFAGSDLISERRQEDARDGIGVLDGRTVSFREYDLVRQQVRLELQDREAKDIEWDEEIWQRLAALRSAERLGISVPDEEIVEMLRNDPSFLDADGRFDPVRYRAILESMAGMTPEAYQSVRRQQMMIGKLERAITSAAWGVPSVAEEQGRGVTDRFTVHVVEVSNTFSTAETSLDQEEIDAFFRDNLATYRIPERVSVRYVEFPASRFKDQVVLDEDDVRDFYDANLDRYEVESDGRKTTLSFEQAQAIVESELRQQESRELAAEAAADFADVFYAGVGAGSDFERLAQEQGLSVRTSGLFAADEFLPGVDRTSSFVASAFDLDAQSLRDQFSDAIVGREASYVLAFHERQEARDPDLSEVLETVRDDAVEFHRLRLFQEHVERLHGTLTSEMAKGRGWDGVLAELELQAGTNIVLTAVDAYQSLPGGQSLATRMLRMSEAEVSPVVFFPDRAVFLQVVERQPGESLQFQMMSSQMAMQLRNGIAEQIRSDWRRYMLASMNLVTSRRTLAVEADAEGDAREP